MTNYAELKRLAEAAKAAFSNSYEHTSNRVDFEMAASPDVVLSMIAEIDKLRTQNQALVEAIKGFHTWAYGQRKQQSKGGNASFDYMELREQMDIAEAALAQAEGGV